uniref:Uncharacterized protein n=1 Tax=Arundo donax TaxID=35708 RepID=A0A0A9BNI6_ARUDO
MLHTARMTMESKDSSGKHNLPSSVISPDLVSKVGNYSGVTGFFPAKDPLFNSG